MKKTITTVTKSYDDAYKCGQALYSIATFTMMGVAITGELDKGYDFGVKYYGAIAPMVEPVYEAFPPHTWINPINYLGAMKMSVEIGVNGSDELAATIEELFESVV